MGFANFLINGSYTSIERVVYSKNTKSISFSLVTYADNTKTALIKEDAYTFEKMEEFFYDGEVVNETDVDILPDGEYLSLTGGVGYSGSPQIFKKGDQFQLKQQPCTYGTVYISKIDNSRKILDETNKIWTEADERNSFSLGVFNKYFSLSDMNGQGQDIYRQIYLFLKTLPEFGNTIDIY